ncbi:hypothetical protein [Sediminivirga luteola]|uniref:EcsC family protein n=1 Tax=Sediminivirga luteola TaxID=1774748 RepID=A0A8J2TXP9_9MICO|nr:hypothetical protein [Sediminivirga luteola]GGA13794.1 hypothetical protein GCM10011333_15870 [Sediminivirga luteola]
MPKDLSSVSRLAVRKDGSLNPVAQSTLLKLLSVQRPVVLAYVRQVRRRHPDASPQELVQILESQYRWIATGGGAAVGATAVVPGVGTGAALVLATAETAGFLEGSALFAQALAEVHGIQVNDPQRANVLVMGVMLGKAGTSLIRQYSTQQETPPGGDVSSHWGAMVATQIPNAVLNKLVKQLKRTMLRRFTSKQGASVVGKIMPFGIGAVIGGAANRSLANSVVKHSRQAFGPAPAVLPDYLEPDPADSTSAQQDRDLVGGLKHLMTLLRRRKRADAGPGNTTDDDVIPGELAEEALPPGNHQR